MLTHCDRFMHWITLWTLFRVLKSQVKSWNLFAQILLWHSPQAPLVLPSRTRVPFCTLPPSLGIPQLAILTDIDEACGDTEINLKNVYKSKHLKKKMADFSSSVGIPINRILPVKNYSEEIELNPDDDTLILSALKLMIDFGNNYAAKL
ncbi:interferon-induced protein 44-like [Fundulus heteroclitus]|uniref:interferon-induced protein 44-like n=1 Tax=Fundulus heteroclitus TaxID=8078 RepID=UPI00165C7AC9|nr:interferon-induced protein 44-like [Fundulus heteroclitus]